jgi:hypothetical protein
MKDSRDSFFARWSRRKARERDAEPAAKGVPVAPEGATPPVAELPPLDSLTPASDFSAFMRPDVDPALRRAALGKLFADARFNALDGLDTYIDDYTKADPLPAGMLEKLAHWQNILATQSPPEAAADGAVTAVPPDTQQRLTDARARTPGAAAGGREPVPEPREGGDQGGTPA